MNSVDVAARLQMAAAIRAYASGRITNFEYENRVPCTSDPVVREIDNELWCCYDDFKEHRAVGHHSFDVVARKYLARCVLFLHSKQPYEWPKSPPGIWSKILTFGWSEYIWRRYHKAAWSQGDLSVWPFRSEEALHQEAKRPRKGLL